MKIAVGMDLHAKKSTAFAVPANPSAVLKTDERTLLDGFNKEFASFPSDSEGMMRMVRYLEGNTFPILIENSTKTHEIYWMLTNMGCDVTVAFAADLYRITKSTKKTDRHDAEELAGYMRRRMNGEDEFMVSYMPSPEWLMRRELCRTLYDESKALSDTRRQIRSHMLLHGIKPEREFADIAGPSALKMLGAVSDPVLKSLVSRADSQRHRCADLLKTVGAHFGNDGNYRLLQTIPGVGPVIAAYISSLTVDIGRFGSGKQFAAFIGIVPRMHESAESSPRCGITRSGDPLAREMVFQAALVHVYNEANEATVITRLFRRLYSRDKTDRRMAFRKAMTAASRKMAAVMFSVMKNGEPYKTR